MLASASFTSGCRQFTVWILQNFRSAFFGWRYHWRIQTSSLIRQSKWRNHWTLSNVLFRSAATIFVFLDSPHNVPPKRKNLSKVWPKNNMHLLLVISLSQKSAYRSQTIWRNVNTEVVLVPSTFLTACFPHTTETECWTWRTRCIKTISQWRC